MTRAIPVLMLVALFAGCEEVEPRVRELQSELSALRAENAELQARVAELESSLSASRETTLVTTREGGIELRLNAETAMVLIAIVAGIVVLLVFFMRYRLLAEQARWERAPPSEQ